MREFFNLYNHGFFRVAVGIPDSRVADPAYNAEATIDLLRQAAADDARLMAFPELGLSAYTCDDLFHQQALLDASLMALDRVRRATVTLPTVAVVGVPLRIENLLFNCAVVLHRGQIIGVAPKTFLPNYREFYELRQFAPATALTVDSVALLGQRNIPVGNRLMFSLVEPGTTLHGHSEAFEAKIFVEVCEDVWVPIPPSSYAALAGATVLVNLSASNITVGKADYRHSLVQLQSARCLAAYLYTAAGTGESTTDLAWDGHGLIYENGNRLAETSRFQYRSHYITADIDLDRLQTERMRQTSFAESVRAHAAEIRGFREIAVPVELPRKTRLLLRRDVPRFPYVPADPQTRESRCYESYHIQVQGLVKRLQSTGIERVVIGISGGLDSTQALIVAARAMDVLNLPRTNILAYTMPGFATSERTLSCARRLMQVVGCAAHELDIRRSARQMLENIGHPFASGQPVFDVTFENVQAGERTSHLFRLANLHHALVVGTGDLSELALGWATYGVGDQMSHYAVNASIPKTLIQYLIRWVADTNRLGAAAGAVLRDILDTEISPELIPSDSSSATSSNDFLAATTAAVSADAGHASADADSVADAQPTQRTEAIIGPYELQDFNLYHILRFGFRPSKVAFLAYCAWRDKTLGTWPDIPETRRQQYDIGTIKQWLRAFVWRFFKTSQFKRTAIPNAPKVGSGGSLSPRGDWRAPSDSEAAAWLANTALIPDTDPDPHSDT